MSESEPQWTPGPARVIDRIDQANHGRRVVASGRVVAECSALDPETNQANADLFASAEDLYAELEDAARHYEETANTLDAWARQSREGAWSTHQVKANREMADSLRRKSAGFRLALARARGEDVEVGPGPVRPADRAQLSCGKMVCSECGWSIDGDLGLIACASVAHATEYLGHRVVLRERTS